MRHEQNSGRGRRNARDGATGPKAKRKFAARAPVETLNRPERGGRPASVSDVPRKEERPQRGRPSTPAGREGQRKAHQAERVPRLDGRGRAEAAGAAPQGDPRSRDAGRERPPARSPGPRPSGEGPFVAPSRLWIYGRHAALAAIANPRRKIKRIFASDVALDWLSQTRMTPERRDLIQSKTASDIDRCLHDGAVHQGVAIEVEALARPKLNDACTPDGMRRPVVVLDQITDPHNIGAIFRSAAAFGARAIIVQDRRTPPLSGALAKAAGGAIETVPCIEVVNIARTLDALKELGYFCAGLNGAAGRAMSGIPRDRPIALVLGAEGAGLRRLVAETCDELFRIQIDGRMESLNVSNAAAIALYESRR